MAKATSLPKKQASAGDAAVSGLFAGLGAGALMVGFLALAGWLAGQGMGTYLQYFAAGEQVSILQGLLTHLAVSGVYGMLFGLGWRAARGTRLGRAPGWMGGLAYGILLWMVAVTVILPGTGSPLRSIPPGWFAAAHGVFGLALGVLARAPNLPQRKTRS